MSPNEQREHDEKMRREGFRAMAIMLTDDDEVLDAALVAFGRAHQPLANQLAFAFRAAVMKAREMGGPPCVIPDTLRW